jgi:hypothetical protein
MDLAATLHVHAYSMSHFLPVAEGRCTIADIRALQLHFGDVRKNRALHVFVILHQYWLPSCSGMFMCLLRALPVGKWANRRALLKIASEVAQFGRRREACPLLKFENATLRRGSHRGFTGPCAFELCDWLQSDSQFRVLCEFGGYLEREWCAGGAALSDGRMAKYNREARKLGNVGKYNAAHLLRSLCVCLNCHPPLSDSWYGFDKMTPHQTATVATDIGGMGPLEFARAMRLDGAVGFWALTILVCEVGKVRRGLRVSIGEAVWLLARAGDRKQWRKEQGANIAGILPHAEYAPVECAVRAVLG